MQLDCYRVLQNPPKIVPGHSQRDWMDSHDNRHPYRCLPLTMANSTGWEILCPMDLKIVWDGGKLEHSLSFFTTGDPTNLSSFVGSHFRYGIVTFHTGHLFRTPPGWGTWVMGPPNRPKEGIQPLTGLVETDWLPFPFTMNWQMMRPGEVIFRKDEPFCFVTLMEHKKLEEVQPTLRYIFDDKELKGEYDAWVESRNTFNEKLSQNDKGALKEGWQRHYMRGKKVSGGDADAHQTKRRLKDPVEWKKID